MHSISASIVVFNNDPNQVKRASDCLLESEYLTKLYIVDNSPAGAFAREFSGHERIEYILTGSNLGYGRAHNIALKRSIHEGVPYHIVMNPDVYFSYGTIEKLFEFMENQHNVGLIMPKVLYPDGSLQYLCKMIPTPMDVFARRFLSFGFLNGIVEKNNDRFELRFTGYDKVMNIPYLSGCFMFLRTCALIDVGLFDD